MMSSLLRLPIAFTGNAAVPGTSNVAAEDVPFQRWYNFKEAFTPSFVAEVTTSLPFRVRTCLDPFSGCGTTSLTCQFMGVRPTTIEVNPFLADLAEAKLAVYDRDELHMDRRTIADRCTVADFLGEDLPPFPGAPETFVEPGKEMRWIFDLEIARRLQVYRNAIEAIENEAHRRLFRVLLGSVLIPVSNVTISGKGRRYRKNWDLRMRCAADVDRLFQEAFVRAYFDICRYPDRACSDYTLLRGDSRERIRESEPADLVLFSPPYPNSFDYTDIYNVELWALGYLSNGGDNRVLREATLRSHVQIKREFADGDQASPTLAQTVQELKDARGKLWNGNIPEMVAAYFEDLGCILREAKARLTERGQVVMVVGDSRYAHVLVDVPRIVREMVASLGFRCEEVREVRSMRSSPQHGGRLDLKESLIRLAPI
jgi:hypothetical protein